MCFICGNVLISHNTCIVYIKLKIISSENACIIVMRMLFNKNDFNSFYDYMGKFIILFQGYKIFLNKIFIKVTPETF